MKRKNMMPMAGRTVVVTGAAGGKELAQIVLKAQSYLQDAGFDIKFSHSAVAKLIQVAAGFPWFVHVLGQHCVMKPTGTGTAPSSELTWTTPLRESLCRFSYQCGPD
jgi:hypothetical protein